MQGELDLSRSILVDTRPAGFDTNWSNRHGYEISADQFLAHVPRLGRSIIVEQVVRTVLGEDDDLTMLEFVASIGAVLGRFEVGVVTQIDFISAEALGLNSPAHHGPSIPSILPKPWTQYRTWDDPAGVDAYAVPPPIRHPQAAVEKSPWADAIGPLYSLDAVVDEFSLSTRAIDEAVSSRAILAIESAEGDLLFPVQQFNFDGTVVRGLRRLLTQIPEGSLNAYMIAEWLNTPLEILDEVSPWAVLREGRGVTGALERAVGDLVSRMIA